MREHRDNAGTPKIAVSRDDRGATELKGVPGEWRLFAVAGDG